MARFSFPLLLLACSLVSVSYQASAPTPNAFFTWDGFNFDWQRVIPVTGLRLGHELGNFGASLINEVQTLQDNTTWKGKATASMTFTPGPNDGDYAYPATYYSGIYSPGITVLKTLNVPVRFSDEATANRMNNSVNAHSSFQAPISAKVPPGYDQYEMSLVGYNVEMSCDPAKQPSNYPCNPDSDSIYPTQLHLDVSSCNTNGNVMSCLLEFDVGRGIPPLSNIPDDFNWAVDYDITLSFHVLGANNTLAQFFRAPSTEIESSGTKQDAETGTSKVTLKNSHVDFTQAVVGLAGFGFTIKDVKYPGNGRSLLAYIFNVDDTVSMTSTRNSDGTYDITAEYSWEMGVEATIQSVPSNCQLLHRPLAIFLTDASTMIPNQNVHGSVCKSDLGGKVPFACQQVGIVRDHLTTQVGISVTAKVA